MKKIDITENIASGNVEHIISILKRYLESGYDKLYWDGYDSSICVFKSTKSDNGLTTVSPMPKDLEERLVTSFKRWINDC